MPFLRLGIFPIFAFIPNINHLLHQKYMLIKILTVRVFSQRTLKDSSLYHYNYKTLSRFSDKVTHHWEY